MEKYDPLDDLPVQFRRHSASPTPSHFSIITNTPSPEANTRNQQGFRVFEQGSGQGLGNPETLDHLRILPHSKTELPDGKKRNQTLLEVS